MNTQVIYVLLVEDNPGDTRLIVEGLREATQPRFEVMHVERLSEAVAVLNERVADVILLDLSLPDGHGETTVDRIVLAAPQTPVVILSGAADEEFALSLVGHRVQDYLVKGQVSDLMLVRALRYAIERKRSEKQRLELQVECGRVQLFKQFISDAAHDLRTPLTIVSTSLYLLGKNALSEREIDYLTTINAQIAHLQSMVEDMVTLSELESGNIHFFFQPCRLNVLVETAVAQQQRLIEKKKHHLSLELDPALPELQADPVELMRAMSCLIVNALNYTPDCGDIRIKTSVRDGMAVMEIIDHGIGISSEDQILIFTRFYRADKARSIDTGGTGLGLPIAQKIIERHEGKLVVQSAVGQGSTFSVSLPLAGAMPL